VVGLGPRDDLGIEKVRRAAGIAARSLGNSASVALALPALDAAHVRAVVDGFRSGLYRFDGYRSGKSKAAGVSEVVVLSDVARQAEVTGALAASRTVGELVDLARDWVNTPANELLPRDFAGRIEDATRGTQVGYELLDSAALAELGCGGILAVGQGSAAPPCLVRLTWEPDEPVGSVAFVGKGITYDSGGLTIKPGSSMKTQKMDMAGAAAAVAATLALAALDVPVRVTAYLPLAENMISGSSLRPGDVLTTLSGRTVEVLNTDAEGRLVLADVCWYTQDRFKPKAMIDLATLTGAVVVALGHEYAGLFANNEELATRLLAASQATGELLWRLPLAEAYDYASKVMTENMMARDSEEGIGAFIEKRDPSWEDR